MVESGSPEALPADSKQASSQAPEPHPACYSVTIFTQRWHEIRDFYVDILSAKVLGELDGHHCELDMGGVPICLRKSEFGETTSYFHLYLSVRNRAPILAELRRRGIIITHVGQYTNFRDPEGRVIKLSESRTLPG
jgi:catechol 2,3-dioxygenase-like lactoylglutathione lyase family enzyme